MPQPTRPPRRPLSPLSSSAWAPWATCCPFWQWPAGSRFRPNKRVSFELGLIEISIAQFSSSIRSSSGLLMDTHTLRPSCLPPPSRHPRALPRSARALPPARTPSPARRRCSSSSFHRLHGPALPPAPSPQPRHPGRAGSLPRGLQGGHWPPTRDTAISRALCEPSGQVFLPHSGGLGRALFPLGPQHPAPGASALPGHDSGATGR